MKSEARAQVLSVCAAMAAEIHEKAKDVEEAVAACKVPDLDPQRKVQVSRCVRSRTARQAIDLRTGPRLTKGHDRETR